MSSPVGKPLFSVIIATYNRAHLLPRAVNSALNQSYQNFEVIIIDDGSTDNTSQVLESFKGDPRIVYHRHKENMGLSTTWNKGLDLAKGDYVVFLDDDDELSPKALENAVSKIIELSPKGVRTIWFDAIDSQSGEITGKGINGNSYITYEDHLCGKIDGDFYIVIDRNLIGENRFDERTWGGTATLLWLKIFYQAKVFHVAEVFGVIHREHGSTVSNDFRTKIKWKEKYLWTHRIFLQEFGQDLKKLCPGEYGNRRALLGLFCLLNGEGIEGRKELLESLKYHFSLQSVFLFLMSFILNARLLGYLLVRFVDIKNSVRKTMRSFNKPS